jgi:hypothetical protein
MLSWSCSHVSASASSLDVLVLRGNGVLWLRLKSNLAINKRDLNWTHKTVHEPVQFYPERAVVVEES